MDKLSELNLKALTTLNYSPKNVNIGSVNFNVYMNNTNNKNNPGSSSSNWIDSLMNPLMATVTNPNFLSSLSSNKKEQDTKLERCVDSYPSTRLYNSTGTSSTGPTYFSTSTGTSSTGPTYFSTSTGPTSTGTSSTGTSSTGHTCPFSTGTSHNYNELEHIFVIDGNRSGGYKLSCSCVSPTGCSDLSTTEPKSISETQENTESSVTIENEN
jgi:hypothetical protein